MVSNWLLSDAHTNAVSGGRDRAGRAVVEVYGDHPGWRSPGTVKELCQMLLYFHTVIRYTATTCVDLVRFLMSYRHVSLHD